MPFDPSSAGRPIGRAWLTSIERTVP